MPAHTKATKAKRIPGCKGKGWTCIEKWVGGWNVCLCSRCNGYAVALVSAHEKKRAERRESGLVDIRTDQFNAIAKAVGPKAKLHNEMIAAE